MRQMDRLPAASHTHEVLVRSVSALWSRSHSCLREGLYLLRTVMVPLPDSTPRRNTGRRQRVQIFHGNEDTDTLVRSEDSKQALCSGRICWGWSCPRRTSVAPSAAYTQGVCGSNGTHDQQGFFWAGAWAHCLRYVYQYTSRPLAPWVSIICIIPSTFAIPLVVVGREHEDCRRRPALA